MSRKAVKQLGRTARCRPTIRCRDQFVSSDAVMVHTNPEAMLPYTMVTSCTCKAHPRDNDDATMSSAAQKKGDASYVFTRRHTARDRFLTVLQTAIVRTH